MNRMTVVRTVIWIAALWAVGAAYGAEPKKAQETLSQSAINQLIDAVERVQAEAPSPEWVRATLAGRIQADTLRAEQAALSRELEALKEELAGAQQKAEKLAADLKAKGRQATGPAQRLAALRRLEGDLSALLLRTPDADEKSKTSATAPNRSAPSAAPAMAILNAHCFACHNEEKAKGRLVLTSRASALEGGRSGPVIVVGNSAESRLSKVLAPDADPHMPPKKQLSDHEIGVLRAWIDAGAPWDEAALAAGPTEPVKLGLLPSSYQPVLAIAISPDQKRLAEGRGNRIYLRDLQAEGQPIIVRFDGHQDAVQSLAFSPDGTLLASGGYASVRLWNVSEKKIAHQLTGLDGRVTALAFTPDGSTLVTASGQPSQGAAIHLWSTAGGQRLSSWTAHDDTIFDLDISTDGKLLATAGADTLAKVWDLATRKAIATLEGHTQHVLSVAFKPDGKQAATGSADKDLKIWSIGGQDQTITIRGHGQAVTGVVWKADGSRIVSSCADGVIRLSEVDQKKVVKNFAAAGQVLYAVACSRDGKTVYGGGHDGVVFVWGEDGKIRAKLTADEPSPDKAATAPVRAAKVASK